MTPDFSSPGAAALVEFRFLEGLAGPPEPDPAEPSFQVMGKYHLPLWLQAAVATSGSLGLFLVAFLDSSFIPFPSLNDLLLIDLSIQNPARMPAYAAVSTLGSVMGCLVLYFIGRKGEEAAFHDKGGAKAHRIHRWVQQNGFLSMLVAALLPPPTPFKIFVLAAGALGMPLRTFFFAILIARAARFFGEGYLAIRYGTQAADFLTTHKLSFALGTLLTVLLVYLVYRLAFRHKPQEA